MRHALSRRSPLIIAGLVVSGLLAVAPGSASGDPGDPGDPGPATASTPDDDGRLRSVTLVTGDRLDVRDETGGHRSIEFVPGPGREDITVHELEVDGESHVYPVDVFPYLAADRIDDDLFNVDLLLADGYDDDSLDTVPLIASTSGDLRAAGALDGAEPGASLASIEARALDVAKDDASAFWADLTADRARLAPGITKLWLDHRVEADLDRSVPQIGAPAAWEAGFDGAGVTVAVLDTGVDADHPDLAGQVTAEQNFSESDSVDDAFGHGTHVAATIAGSGDGSEPRRSGVAPGAEVLSGKVLGDDGTGWTSDIIEAMEWAVGAERRRGEHEPRRRAHRRHRPAQPGGRRAERLQRHPVRGLGRQRRPGRVHDRLTRRRRQPR